MKTEYEVRVLEINVEELVDKIEKLGAQKIGDWDQKRYVYDLDGKTKWIRLRTNGEKTTLTYKEITKKTIDGTKEIEFEIKDFEAANEFLEKVGHTNGRFQENHRIRYMLNGVELDIDTWPKIPTYLEIEGKNEEEVYNMIKTLGLENEKITTTDVSELYRDYGFDIRYIKKLQF